MENIQEKLLNLYMYPVSKKDMGRAIDFTESIINSYAIKDPEVTLVMAQMAAALQMRVILSFYAETGLPSFPDHFAISRLRYLGVNPETLQVVHE